MESLRTMQGIEFIVDSGGRKKAVLIDLEKQGELWEDIYDVLVSHSRENERTVSWRELKAELQKEKIRHG